MDALKQSPMALNVQSAPFVRALQNVVCGPRSYKPFKSAFIKTRLSRSHNALSPKIQGTVRHRTLVVKADSTAESYATALAELAQSTNILEPVNSDIEKLSQFLVDKQFSRFLVNPIIPDDKKKGIVKAISDDAKFQTYTLNFLYLLIDKKRIGILSDIVKEFELAYNKLTDTELAVVTSVVKLENQHLTEIAKKVQSFTKAKNIRLKTIIDPSLIAGFTIRYGKTGSRLIDMSVKTQMEKLAGQIGYTEKIAAL
eukprot:Gb_38201 [translate_table: standard]